MQPTNAERIKSYGIETGGESGLLLSGIDSLYVSYAASIQASRIDLDNLEYLKQKAGRDRSAGFAEIELGTERFAVLPRGAHPYRYVLQNKDFEVRLSEHMQPGCYVQFFSEALWLKGIEAMTARVADWQHSVGLHLIRPEGVSRCDWAFDYHLPEVDFEPEHFVSRAVKDACWRQHNAVQSVQFGQGDVVVRLYDKCAEIEQQSHKAFMYELWGRRDHVWRVEFQVRGPRLQRSGIHTLSDLGDHAGDLLRDLATGHTSLRRPGEDSNRSRWPLHPLWRDLTAQIAAMGQMGLVAEIDEAAPLAWRRHRLGKSLLGMLKGAGVLEYLQSDRSEVPDLEWVLDELPGLLKPHHNEIEWEQDIRRKVKAEGYGL